MKHNQAPWMAELLNIVFPTAQLLRSLFPTDAHGVPGAPPVNIRLLLQQDPPWCVSLYLD